MSHYLWDEVNSAVLGTIKITRIFADYWRRVAKYGGALQLENRLLDNDEVWDVLAYMGRPQSKLEMERRLGQSVWDPIDLSRISRITALTFRTIWTNIFMLTFTTKSVSSYLLIFYTTKTPPIFFRHSLLESKESWDLLITTSKAHRMGSFHDR